MARLFVVALAARLPRWAREARDEYLARMPKGFEVRCLELKAASLERIRKALPRDMRIAALDERGRDMTTRQFAALLAQPTAFVIGGPEGLEDAVKRAAFLQLRLSSLTLPHALAQVLVAEQLYRAASLLTGHPYHRE